MLEKSHREIWASKKRFIIAGAVFLLFGIGWISYHFVFQQAHQERLTLYGNVDIRDVALSFRVAGRLEKVLVEEGDQVTKGLLIATLDKEPAQEAYAVAKAEVAQAQAALKNAEIDYKRQKELTRTGTKSQKIYEEALATRDEAKAQLQAAEARLAQAKTALKDTELRAPSAGIILTRIQEPGAMVAIGDPVYTMMLDNPIWIRAFVGEPDLGRLYPGQPAKIFTDTHPQSPYKGHVGFISPQAEFTPKSVETPELRADLVYRLRIIVDGVAQGLRQGMPVTIEIDALQKPADKTSRGQDEKK